MARTEYQRKYYELHKEEAKRKALESYYRRKAMNTETEEEKEHIRAEKRKARTPERTRNRDTDKRYYDNMMAKRMRAQGATDEQIRDAETQRQLRRQARESEEKCNMDCFNCPYDG